MSSRVHHAKTRSCFGLVFLAVFSAVCAGTVYSHPAAGRQPSPTPTPVPTCCLPATTTQWEPNNVIFQKFPARGPAETAWGIVWSEYGHKGLWIEAAVFWRKPPFTLSNAIHVLGQAGLSNIFVPYHN